MPLDMGNLTDDDSENLLLFARAIARMTFYRGDWDADDAVATLNNLIAQARALLKEET